MLLLVGLEFWKSNDWHTGSYDVGARIIGCSQAIAPHQHLLTDRKARPTDFSAGAYVYNNGESILHRCLFSASPYHHVGCVGRRSQLFAIYDQCLAGLDDQHFGAVL